MNNALRDAAAVDVRSRVLSACIAQSELPDGVPLDVLINETLYQEKKRLEAHSDTPGWSSDAAFWEQVKSRLGRASEHELRELLGAIIGRYVDEVTGNFNPMVYALTTRFMPRALSVTLNAMSPRRLMDYRGLPALSETIKVQGEMDALQRCHEQGTVILTPTHVSNMDSVIVGWALFKLGLPPFAYGAGLNLFSNPVLSFFMHNLGAYRVDRLKKARLYKDVLKEYATVTLEHGQPNLFFPAGTRVRSGRLEEHLKLGLLSSGIKAYIGNLQRKRENPRIFIVPCTLNYHLVLEATTLIEDHLKAVGRSRYIITDDESSRPRQILRFLHGLANLDSRITITVGAPLDPFGNRVDDDGESVDRRGRRIDITRYVMGPDGTPVQVPQRDRIYTEEAGKAVAAAFRADNVVLSTNLVAFTLFQMLRRRHAQMDLYRLLRTAGDGSGVEFGVLATAVRDVTDQIRVLASAGQIQLDDAINSDAADEVVTDALRHFGTYHESLVMRRRGDRIFPEDMNLLLYYHNRLTGYGLTVDGAEEFRT